MENRPLKRNNDLVQHELDGEILIYDLLSDKAYCLNETAAIVWQACDGEKSVDDISKRLGSEDLAWLALDELKKQKLIEHETAKPAKFEGVTRREAVKRIGVSTALALPIIASLTVPVMAQGTVCGRTCGNNNQCDAPCPICVNPGGGGNGVCAAA